VQLWHERMQTFQMLISWKKGNSSSSNIIRRTLRQGVPYPRQMALEEMEAHAKYCKALKQQLKGGDSFLRYTHIHNCLIDAHTKKDKVRAQQIKAKMEKEANSKMWYWINRSQKDPRCSAFHVMQRVVGRVVQESDGQEETEDFIFEETEVRFQLAAEAPISNAQQIEQLGYLGDS